MRDQEQHLLKSYLRIKDRTPKLTEVVLPHFVLNLILFIPCGLGGLFIYFFGVKEVAYLVLGVWLGHFLCDIRHGKIFVSTWPKMKKYLDWQKVENGVKNENS